MHLFKNYKDTVFLTMDAYFSNSLNVHVQNIFVRGIPIRDNGQSKKTIRNREIRPIVLNLDTEICLY